MGIYSKTLLEREVREKILVEEADQALKNQNFNHISSNPLDELQIVLSRLFEKYHIQYKLVHGCKTTLELMECVLDTHKIMYEKIDMETPDKWKRSNCHIIAFTEGGSPILMSPTLFGYRWIGAWDNKGKKYNKKNLKLQKEGYMIFAPLPKKINSVGAAIKYVFTIMRPINMVIIISSTLIISLLGLMVPKINNWVLKDFVRTPYEDKNWMLFVGMMIIFIVRGLVDTVLMATKQRIQTNATIETSAIIEKGLMARILMLPYSYFQTTSSGKFNRYLKNASTLTNKIIAILLGATITFLFSLVHIPQLFEYGPNVAGYALLFLLAEIIISFIIAFATAKNERYVLETLNEAENAQFTTLKGIQKIKGVGAEKRFYSKWARAYRRYLNYSLDPSIFIKLANIITSFVSDGLLLFVLLFAFPTNMETADYISFTSALAFISTAVKTLTKTTKDFIGLRPLVDFLKPILNETSEESTQLEYVRNLKGNIRLEHIKFAYDKNNPLILNDISLNIRAGEKIAIVGESGCGKSTFIKLILGLVEADSGCIYFDGYPLPTLNGGSLRKNITSVCQFNKLFPGTIYSNLTLSNPDLTEEEAWEALRKASMDDDVRALQLGIDTEISESISCGFSGGQRQRLMLARAFASKNNILILDEATSALDNQTQENVLKSVYAMKGTVIMVAHRLSTVVDCDRILVFQKGQVAEDGNYNQLMEKNGIFADLMRKQQLKENEKETD